MKKIGKVYLIGAGPGDPGLFTLKGAETLKKADVILYDRLISKDILKYKRSGAVLKYVGKAKGNMYDQTKINKELLDYARAGRIVARLKGGDPFIFGRGQEETVFLKENGVECEVIPGISSFYAVPEVCGIPLTHRSLASGFMVLTGHEDAAKKTESIDWRQAAQFKGTVVIMMGLSNLKEITGKLMRSGKEGRTLAAVIASGTTKKEKVVVGTLADIAEKSKGLSSPAVCVIGPVVQVGFSLNQDLKPLTNKRFISTASNNLNRDIAKGLKRYGASVDLQPMITIEPNKDTTMIDGIIKNVKTYEWLVFTSRHGVYYFLKRYDELHGRMKDLRSKIACVGTGTAREFTKRGMTPDLMPKVFTTKDLGRALLAKGVKGKNIALIRTKMEKDYLKKMLLDAKAKVTDCYIYNVVDTKDKKAIKESVAKKQDGIFFMSPRSARVFFNSIPQKTGDRIKRYGSLYSIGPVTTRELKKQGARHVMSAEEYTVDGLVDLCLKETR